MVSKWPAGSFLGVTAALLCTVVPSLSLADTDDALLAQSREITSRFAGELQQALQQAIATGGPVAAISVCKDVAPQIASRLSRQSGAKVSRTSLRFRNPGNAPEPWQKVVLAGFDSYPGNSTPPDFFERNGNNEARYMRAIPTGVLCLACHGTLLADGVRQQLDRDYPHDLARGYQAGDIRGAFSVTWPAVD